MNKKENDLRLCPFRLAANPKVPEYFTTIPEKDRVELMKSSLCCFKELCQWWWLCSGGKLDFLIIEIDSFLKLVQRKIGEAYAKK